MLRFIREAEEIPAEAPVQTPAQASLQASIQMPPVQPLASPAPPEILPVESDLTGRTTSNWRGVVTHIQSGAEQHFSSLAEAENFIKKYIED